MSAAEELKYVERRSHERGEFDNIVTRLLQQIELARRTVIAMKAPLHIAEPQHDDSRT